MGTELKLEYSIIKPVGTEKNGYKLETKLGAEF